MEPKNSVYIGVSLDGYIADKDGGLDWLDFIPNPEGSDMGYYEFMSGIDALVMGRNTFEVVDGFDIDWPYKKPVFVLSNSLTEVPEKYKGKVYLLGGEPGAGTDMGSFISWAGSGSYSLLIALWDAGTLGPVWQVTTDSQSTGSESGDLKALSEFVVETMRAKGLVQ